MHLIGIIILIFFMALSIGSFLNVCIYRIPADSSIFNPPRSHCPQCGSQINAYDNIPVFSYLWLRGKCRNCKNHIPFRYPLVELITGIFGLAVLYHYGLSIPAFIYFIFICMLIVISFIDIDHQIIPNEISLPGIPIGLIASFFLPEPSFIDAIIGVLVGGGSLLLVAWLYETIKKIEGLGGGDIKLMAMIGAFLGWKGVFFTIFMGSMFGLVAGILGMIFENKNAKHRIPFAPFLSSAAILFLFFGNPIINWYLNFIYYP